MMSRLSVRARLTAFVTVVFGAAVTIGALVLFDAVEERLIDDTRASAETVLSNHLASIVGRAPAVGAEAVVGSSFFFLDASGADLSEEDYLERVLEFRSGETEGPTFTRSGETVDGSPPGFARMSIDPETGQIVAADGRDVAIPVGPVAVGDAQVLDRGETEVAVAQRIELPTGAQLTIGVSSPLQPVTDSLDALRSTLWYVIPVLVAAVGAITWLAAIRALRPVHAITTQTRTITATNLSERVPIPVARDDIHDLAGTMNDMLDRLEHSQRQQRQFIADASHELRSPVAASRAQLEVGLAACGTDWQTTAATVLAEQEHLGDLIDDLLTLGRLDEQGLGETAEVDLEDLMLTEGERPHRHPVVAEFEQPVRVAGNRALLGRALRNLVDNADRYAREEVRLGLEHDGGVVRIHVDDDGPGVPEDRRVAIFSRFARVDESRQRDEGGTGLGLAIVDEIIRLHDGTVDCADSPSGGARFTIRLPVEPGPEPALL